MAPRKLTQIERWIGTEAERLALDASGFSPGSTFFERDTGSMYKWDGTSWGKEIITVADIAGIKTAIESLDNFGGTAADIGTLKLENGQIKGYDGTDWQPVRVNDAGELILASEVTVNAEGLSVDLGKLVLQAKNPGGVPVDMKSDTEGNLKVSLSGAIAQLEPLAKGVSYVDYIQEGGESATDSPFIVYDVDDACIIRTLQFGGTRWTTQMRLSLKDAHGERYDFFRCSDLTDGTFKAMNFKNFKDIHDGENHLFKMIQDDNTEPGRYMHELKKPIIAPHGFRIAIVTPHFGYYTLEGLVEYSA